MRQGNDVGTQYRSGIYTYSESQAAEARASMEAYSQALAARGYAAIATEILPAGEFYFAEDYHQQYLAKNPGGYCGPAARASLAPPAENRWFFCFAWPLQRHPHPVPLPKGRGKPKCPLR